MLPPRGARDFDAELSWLVRLPVGPETDQAQNDWERDPAVIEWRRTRGGTEPEQDGTKSTLHE